MRWEETSGNPWPHLTSSAWGSQPRKEAWGPEEEPQVVLLLSLEDRSPDLLHERLSSLENEDVGVGEES